MDTLYAKGASEWHGIVAVSQYAYVPDLSGGGLAQIDLFPSVPAQRAGGQLFTEDKHSLWSGLAHASVRTCSIGLRMGIRGQRD